MTEHPIDKIQIIIHGILAAIGGIVRVLAENKKYSIYYYLSQAVISSFSGVIIGLLLREFMNSEYLTMAFAGVAGYAGSGILHILSIKLQNYLKDKPL